MVTMVGNESDIKELVIYLEHDAIAAYDSCIERLDNKLLAGRAFFMKAHLDEERHRAWMEENAKNV